MGHGDDCLKGNVLFGDRVLAEVLVVFPELGPGLARRSADEDVGVVIGSLRS